MNIARKGKVVILGILILVILCAGLIVFLKFSIRPMTAKRAIHRGNIELSLVRKATHVDQLFEPVQKVKLKGALVGTVDRIVILKDRHFAILDHTLKQVNVFDKSGDFVRRIGKTGSGPGEYLRPTDICSDDNQNIYILDNRLKRVSAFDSMGNYKYSFNFGDLFAENIAVAQDKLYLYGSNYDKPMARCYEVTTGRELFQFVERSEFLSRFGPGSPIISVAGFGGYLLRVYNDKIYVIYPIEYLIRKYNLSGSELGGISGASPFFRPPDPDRKNWSPAIHVKEIYPSFIRGFEVWNNLIFVSFFNLQLEKAYLDIYSVEGQKVNEHSIQLNAKSMIMFPLSIDEEGYFYGTYHPEPSNNLELPNPILVKYRFKPFTH